MTHIFYEKTEIFPFRHQSCKQYDNYDYVPPSKGEGGHISFSVDPWRRRRHDKFVSTIFLESVGGMLPDLRGYIIGTSQRAD